MAAWGYKSWLLGFMALGLVAGAPPVAPDTTTAAAVLQKASETTTTAAAPTNTLEVPYLTPENYEATVAKGTWFVDFFSPYCPHCTALAPHWTTAWQQLVDEGFDKTNDFHMAKVDCVENGDFCYEQNIMGYPYLRLLKNGVEVDQFTDVENHAEHIVAYARDVIAGKRGFRTTTSLPATPVATGAVVKPDTTKEEFPTYPGETVVVNTEYPSKLSKQPASDEDLVQSDKKLPNPLGESEDLDHTSFSRRVTATQDPWFVKFYSPRCPHCTKMAPAWHEMAKALKGKLNVGQVNCDVEKQLCKDAGVEQWPTLLYFTGTIRTEYKSLRGFADLLDFAHGTLAARDMEEVSDIDRLEQLLTTDTTGKSLFVYFYDSATVKEDFDALQRAALSTVDTARIVKSSARELISVAGVKHFPSIYMVQARNKFKLFDAPSPKDIRDYDRVANWMREAWLSSVPQMTATNAQEIFDHSDYVVLGLVDPRDTATLERSVAELRATANKYNDDVEKDMREELLNLRAKKQLKIDEAAARGDKGAEDRAKEIRVEVPRKPLLGFAWIDAVFWNRWLKSRYGIDEDRERPSVVINHQRTARYWDTNESGEPIDVSRSLLVETLEQVLHNPPQIKSRMLILGPSSYFAYLRECVVEHWMLATAVVVFVVVFVTRRRSPGSAAVSLPMYHDEKRD